MHGMHQPASRRAAALSPLRYPGGKRWLVPLLRRWLSLNPRRTLLEPFAGGASVSLAAVAEGLARRAVLCELDDGLAALWQVILGDDAAVLIGRVLELPLCESAALELLTERPRGTVDIAFQTLLRNRLARGGLLGTDGGPLRRGEADRGLFSRWYPETLAHRIARVHAMRDRIEFVHGDCLRLLRERADEPDVMSFIDPPYTASDDGPG
ncbi:MAG TPA: DNA adenine methylase [Solirubrobacteraceae bacterium]|nr:DNA adenine methylase [Solirubrobacteraceae bacterium]